MNTQLSFIFTRRSVRQFTAEPVADDAVRDMLEAAMAGPSAVATDPWAFVVIRQRETLDQLAEILPHGKMLHEAPLAIVVCGDRVRAHDGQESYLIQDCAAAVQNLLLAASALGLGGCWLGTHPNEDRMGAIAALLGIPETMPPFATIALGHPAEHPTPRTRYDASRVHTERW